MANLSVLKYDRSQFYSVVSPIAEEELDFLSFKWLEFSRSPELRLTTIHRVQEGEVGNLPLISYEEYGTTNLWWVIALTSNVVDPFSDVYVGRELTVPDVSNVESFLQSIRTGRGTTLVRVPVVEV